MITLYFAAVLSDTAEVNTGVLSEYRTKRLASLQSPVLRRQMISAELLLNRAVMDRLPSASLPFGIAESEKGKPFFVDLPLSFSLSHSGGRVCCALSDRDIVSASAIVFIGKPFPSGFFGRFRLLVTDGLDAPSVQIF